MCRAGVVAHPFRPALIAEAENGSAARGRLKLRPEKIPDKSIQLRMDGVTPWRR